MKTMVILNPYASKGNAVEHFPEIRSCLEKLDLECEMVQTQYPGHADELASIAAKNGFRRIVAVGGDGTINEVANGILKSGGNAELAIIPTGTCNDFIKTAGISSDIRSACETVKQGIAKKYDVVHVGDRYCVNAVGIGFDVAVVETLQKSQKRQNFAMYLLAVFRNVFSYEGMELTLVNGTTRFERKALMLTIANGVCYGGGFKIAPMANAADGKLNGILLTDMPAWKRIRTLISFLNGTHLKYKETETFLIEELKVVASNPIKLQIEGELMEWPENEITIRVEPQRLKVVVPNDPVK